MDIVVVTLSPVIDARETDERIPLPLDAIKKELKDEIPAEPLVVIEADTINATLDVWEVVYIPVTLSKNPKAFPTIVLNEFKTEDGDGSSIGVIFEADTL